MADDLSRTFLGSGPAGYGVSTVMGAILTAWDPATYANTVTDGAYKYSDCLVLHPSLLVAGRVLLYMTPAGPVILGNTYQRVVADPDPDVPGGGTTNPGGGTTDPGGGTTDPGGGPSPDPGTLPWARTYPDGTAYPNITGGSGADSASSDAFSMAYGSCINAADSDSFTAIKNLAPDYFYLAGDCWYDDGSSGHVAHWNAKFAAPKYAAMLAALPNPQIVNWSDHDFGFQPNAVGVGNAITATANTAYRTQFPSAGLEASNGIYRTWTRGRIRFIMLDERTFKSAPTDTDNSSKTMLGAAQKTWLKGLLASAAYPLIVVLGDTPWVATATAGDDAWKGYNTERQELATAFANSPAKTIRMHGDMHSLAYGHDQLGINRVWQAAPLNNNTIVKAGGEGYIATYPTNTNEGPVAQLFAVVRFTDDGSSIVATYRGYTSDGTERLTDSLTVAAPSGGGGGAAGTALATLGSAVSGGVYAYTGSTITSALSADFTGKTDITIRGITMGQGGMLRPKAGTNIVLEVNAPYELTGGGEIVKWVGQYNRVRIDNSLFGPATEPGTPTATKNRYIQFGDSTSVGARFGTVTRSTFRCKAGPGNPIHAAGDTANATGGVRYTLVTGNLFQKVRPFDENDHETNLMGISSLQLTDGQQVVEFNRYEDCRGEPEVISMKMNHSVIRGNVFHNCVGSASLRHGDEGEVNDNWFFGFQEETGSGSYNRTSAGPRLYGARHKIHHNTIQVNGDGGSRPSATSLFESPLTLDSGDTSPGTTSNGHANIVDVLVEKNLLVRSGNPIVVADNYSTAPTGTIRDNWVVECANAGSDGVRTYGSSPSTAGLTITGNTVYATTVDAGLTVGSGGHLVAPTAADRGARVTYLTAGMVGQGSTFDPWA